MTDLKRITTAEHQPLDVAMLSGTSKDIVPVGPRKYLEPLPLQTVETIEPVRPSFIDDERDAKIKRDVKETLAAILADPTNTSVTMTLYQLGEAPMSANTGHVRLTETHFAKATAEVKEGNPVVRTLGEIKTKLDLINPAVVARTEVSTVRKLLWIIPWTVRYIPKGDEILLLINERKDSIDDVIDTLCAHLWEGRDQALRNAAELATISNRLFETQPELQEAAYSGQLLWAGLSEALKTETDPLRQQSLRTLVNDLAITVVDIQTVDGLNVSTRMGAEVLIANANKIRIAVRRVTDVLLPAVRNNLGVKAAGRQQLELTEALVDIARSAEETIVDTAKDVRKVAVRFEQMNSQGMIDPDKLAQVCTEFEQMAVEIESIRRETEQKARLASKNLSNLTEKMRQRADQATFSRQARDQAQLS